MHRRLLLRVVAVLILFVAWTTLVRIGISDGSRESAYLGAYRFGDWPEDVRDVPSSSDIHLSIFATYASADPTSGTHGAIPELFGHPVVGPEVDSGDSNSINGSRFTTGIRAGAVSSISAFIAGRVDAAPHDQFQLAIYEDSDGAPGHRLATTRSGRLVPDAWNALAIQAVLQPRTSYWLMYNTNGTSSAFNNPTYSPVVGNLFDNAIRSHGLGSRSPLGDRITAVADVTPMVIAMILIGLVAAARRRQAGMVLFVGFVLASVIAWPLREMLFEPYRSYPSGHALRATYVAVAFCFVVTSRLAHLAACLFVALIAVAAVYTGGHYSEEIVGGVLLGWAIAAAAKAFAGDLTRPSVLSVPAVNPVRPSTDSPGLIDMTDSSTGRSRSEADPLASTGTTVGIESHPE